MMNANFIILYVDNPFNSASFYTKLLGKSPTESHPTFVSFQLNSEATLGLWSKHTAAPATFLTGGGGEIGFTVINKETVDLMYGKWTFYGGRVAQKPTTMDFGYTFVILDPDGHRLRVFCGND